MDLLSTSTQDSWILLIITPSLIFTLYKSLQHTLSSFVCCVCTSRSLVTASNSGDSSAFALKPFLNGGSLHTASFLHRFPYRTDLVVPVIFLITPRHGPRRQHRFSVACVSVTAGTYFPSRFLAAADYSCFLRIYCLATDVVRCLFRVRYLERNVVSQPFTSNGYFSGSTVLALSKYATIFIFQSDGDHFLFITVRHVKIEIHLYIHFLLYCITWRWPKREVGVMIFV
jgi:hypothetical protein